MDGGTLLALYITVMAVLIGGFFFLRKQFRKEESGGRAAVAAPQAAGAPAAAGRRGALGRMRRDGGGAEADEADSGSDDDGVDDGLPIDPRDKKAMRKREKLLAKQAREQVRANQEAADSRKHAKEDKYAEKRAAREAEREAQEKEAAAADALRKKEQQEKDAAEFDEWKDMFTVSDAGTVAGDEAGESEDRLEEFVQTIKTRKVVVLDELAAQFHIKTPDVIARIQAMEAAGRLTGVLDDRGKFLSITNEEMDAVAKWINKRGRINVADLVAESNRLIDLNGTAEEDSETLVLEDDEKASA